MERTSRRKVLAGTVVSNKMNKSCVVLVETYKSHPIYKKRVKISKKYLVHDKNDATNIGDRVRIRETRPLSARKHFDLVRIIEKAK